MSTAVSFSSYHHHQQDLYAELVSRPLYIPPTGYHCIDAFRPAFVFNVRHRHSWWELYPADNPDGYTCSLVSETLSPFTTSPSLPHPPLAIHDILMLLNLHPYLPTQSLRQYFGRRLIDFAISEFLRHGHCVTEVNITTTIDHIHDPEGVLHRLADSWLDRFGEEEEERSFPRMVPTASGAVEKTLATGKVRVEREDEECVICLAELPPGSEAVALPCSHAFHGDCVAQWLRKSHFCPLCRFEMPV